MLTSVEIEKTSRDDFGRWSWQRFATRRSRA